MSKWENFKRWLAAVLNVVEHQRLQDLQFKHIDSESNKFATEQARRIEALNKRLNTAEALGRFQAVKLDRQAIDLAAALEHLQAATNALAKHDERVKQMEALILKRAGMAIRRS